VAANDKESPLEYTWSVSKRAYSSLLKEGQLVRDSLIQGEHLYYRFGLTALEGVTEVTFFLTLLEGDVYLLSSNEDPYPNFYSKGVLKSSGNNRIVFTKEELGHNFYLAVSGSQFSEYTLGVAVSRETRNSKDSKSAVKLHLGVNQDYFLSDREEEAYF
jgi:hypothetical protein